MAEPQTLPPQPRVGVGVMVFRKAGNIEQILLHKRKNVTSGSGYWGSGGGFLELGESLKDGAIRELREEAGTKLRVENVRFFGVCNFTDFMPEHSVDVSFLADWVAGEPEEDSAGEAIEWQWFDTNKLPSPLFPVVKRYLEAHKSGHTFLDSKGGLAKS